MTVSGPPAGPGEALLGRAPDRPLPADFDVWRRISEHLDPARARPVLRDNVEVATLDAARGNGYCMLRSPDRVASYVRLAPEEAELAKAMDGTRTVAQLVGWHAKRTGQLAPDRVLRVVADLGGGRMLEELPVDAFRDLERLTPRSLPARVGRSLASAAAGHRYVLADPDRLADLAYRWGGRLLFTPVGLMLMALVALAGLVVFVATWATGGASALVVGDSYLLGAAVLVGLNVVGLTCHEAGHALGAKHADRRVPAAGFLVYFGIPCAFVDTTDMWMAPRRHRLVTTAAGPGFAITFAGAAQLVALAVPALAPMAFPLGLVWYLNSLFNLNPLMALDGYYLLMDWLDVPNLRARATALIVGGVRHPSLWRARRTGEERLVAGYAVLSVLWLVIFAAVLVRLHKDRFSGLWAGLWHTGWPARVLAVGVVAVVLAPLVYGVGRWVLTRPLVLARRLQRGRRRADEPRRLAALRRTELGRLPEPALARLARDATWLRPRRGSEVVVAAAPFPGLVAVVDGALEGRRAADPPGHRRARAEAGSVVGLANVLAGQPSSLSWTAAGTDLLVVPSSSALTVLGRVAHLPPSTAEIEDLLDETPALAHLEPEQRALLARRAAPMDVPAGYAVRLGSAQVGVVASGIVALLEGGEARRGGLVVERGDPDGDGRPPGIARTPARLWVIPIAGSAAAALDTTAPAATAVAWTRPVAGMHGDTAGPPPPPWGPPPETDPDADDRLGRGLGLVILVVGVLALLAVLAAWPPGRVWAETPRDSAVLEARRGPVDVRTGGEERQLREGQNLVVREGDDIEVPPGSESALVFTGGAEAVLCPRVELTLGPLRANRSAPLRPRATLELDRGRILADTAGGLGSGTDLALVVRQPTRITEAADGAARFGVGAGGADVERGVVTVDGARAPETGERPGCAEPGSPDPTGADPEAPETTPTTAADPPADDLVDADEPADADDPAGDPGPAPPPGPDPPPPEPDPPPPGAGASTTTVRPPPTTAATTNTTAHTRPTPDTR